MWAVIRNDYDFEDTLGKRIITHKETTVLAVFPTEEKAIHYRLCLPTNSILCEHSVKQIRDSFTSREIKNQ
jgi:hypothetical protein